MGAAPASSGTAHDDKVVLLRESDLLTWRRMAAFTLSCGVVSSALLASTRSAEWLHYEARNTPNVQATGGVDGNTGDGSIPAPLPESGTVLWAAVGLDAASSLVPLTAVLVAAAFRLVGRKVPRHPAWRWGFLASLLLRLASLACGVFVVWSVERSFRGHASWTAKLPGWHRAVAALAVSALALIPLVPLAGKEAWLSSHGLSAHVPAQARGRFVLSPSAPGLTSPSAVATRVASPTSSASASGVADGARLHFASPRSPRGILIQSTMSV